MNYKHTVTATFLERPNRFIAYALCEGKQVRCHVKNTGRCRELLLPGASVILEHHPDADALGRKTDYSLISVYKNKTMAHGAELVNMDISGTCSPVISSPETSTRAVAYAGSALFSTHRTPEPWFSVTSETTPSL